MDAVQSRDIKPGRAFPAALALLRSAESAVHIAIVNYFLEVSHTTQSLSVYPFGKVVRSFDVVHGFRLMPTLSSFPPERANAVVIVVVVVVDVAGGRDAKKDTTHSLRISASFLRSPGDGHIFHILHHLGPVAGGLIVHQFQIHGQFDVE